MQEHKSPKRQDTHTEKFIKGLQEDNPDMLIEYPESSSQFKEIQDLSLKEVRDIAGFKEFELHTKDNQDSKVKFTQLEQSTPHNPPKYDIDISQFNGVLNVRDGWSMHPVRSLLSTPIVVNNGNLDFNETAYGNLENNIQPPVIFKDRSQSFTMSGGGISPIIMQSSLGVSGRTESKDANNQLQPSASMGKMFTAAMLIKTFEDLEIKIDGAGFKEAKNKLIASCKKHKSTKLNPEEKAAADKIDITATTLMDVPISYIYDFLTENSVESGEMGKVVEFLHAMDPESAGKSKKSHSYNISPRMLLNHTARLKNSFDWKHKKTGETAMQYWNNHPDDATFDYNSILTDYNPPKGYFDQVTYANGCTVVAGLLVEAITGKDIQKNLTEICGLKKEEAVIVTKREDIATAGLDPNTTPSDPGFTAGSFLVTPEAIAKFSQSYLKGELFKTNKYKDYLQNSVKDAALHERVTGDLYENSLQISELAPNDPHRSQGFTHWVGHDGGIPKIATDGFTLVGVENNKIVQVDKTQINMTRFDPARNNEFKKSVENNKRDLDALNLETNSAQLNRVKQHPELKEKSGQNSQAVDIYGKSVSGYASQIKKENTSINALDLDIKPGQKEFVSNSKELSSLRQAWVEKITESKANTENKDLSR